MSEAPAKRRRGRPPKVVLHQASSGEVDKRENVDDQDDEVDIGPGGSDDSADSDDDFSDDDDDDSSNSDDDDEVEEEEEFDQEAAGQAKSDSAKGDNASHVAQLHSVDEPGADKPRRRKRGRPPTIDKPHESRIKAILRAVRRARTYDRYLYYPFERLPDGKQYPEYYREIAQPIALDIIKKKIKRRVYSSVEAYMEDMNLMFENAKRFNAEESQIYRDTVKLQEVTNNVASEELKRPDSAFQDQESNQARVSRIPLDGIAHNGEVYKVGDWVHISNLNDPSRPTVAQIFRTWQGSDGRKWINACWYFRPEQTVHRADKFFYENEVVKSGQYRDHLIDEVLGKCFVMFFTKYQRGRPVGIGNRTVYCCESRYNEHDKTFNKIRTWKACIPDEVRSLDYEMDLFETPHPLKKIPSPIKHLLPENAKEDDPIPEPKMGVENAPPIVGAVYVRPVDPNARDASPSLDSPTPAPLTAPSPAINSPNLRNVSVPRSSIERTLSNSVKQPRPDLGRLGSGYSTPGTPTPPTGYSYNQALTPHLGPSTSTSAPYMAPGPPPLTRTLNAAYNPPPPPSTFTLPEYITDKIPPETAELYQKDENGKLLWFSVPPLDMLHSVALHANAKTVTAHSIKFLASRRDLARKRKQRADERERLFSKTAE
ncbi:hypothetical protein V1514DRAFT_323523 [Lipomyces japonicus]|uniref:uncharacterized protein n=1 Tax=Lipomyces japonicus TaxID=56871 RepID=UPI0034CFDFBC